MYEVLVNRFALVRLAWLVSLASRNCFVALPQDAIGLSAVCDCGISWSYSLTIFAQENFALMN